MKSSTLGAGLLALASTSTAASETIIKTSFPLPELATTIWPTSFPLLHRVTTFDIPMPLPTKRALAITYDTICPMFNGQLIAGSAGTEYMVHCDTTSTTDIDFGQMTVDECMIACEGINPCHAAVLSPNSECSILQSSLEKPSVQGGAMVFQRTSPATGGVQAQKMAVRDELFEAEKKKGHQAQKCDDDVPADHCAIPTGTIVPKPSLTVRQIPCTPWYAAVNQYGNCVQVEGCGASSSGAVRTIVMASWMSRMADTMVCLVAHEWFELFRRRWA
jgi:hypothetical protein